MKMPFGKYKGITLCDIPVSYLEWFAKEGFPPGKLGMLLSTIYEIKINGLEYLLDPLKQGKSASRYQLAEDLQTRIQTCSKMFTRQQASRTRQEFWTNFGKYMSPIRSAEGLKINWMNYHTKIKDIYFRMDTEQKSASIAISIEHSDPEIRELYYQQFLELKTILHATLQEEWEWQLHAPINDRTISRISKTISGVSFLNKDHWPDLISFFKPRIIGLDEFWENARYSFEALK